MEEQEVSVPDGRTIKLNFVLVATANSRRFDPTAKPIPRAVQDRFGAVETLDYLSLGEDIEVLNRAAAESQLGVRPDADTAKRIVEVVKMTQGRVNGFTDYSKYVRTPSGPRGFLDLYAEAAVQALLNGRSNIATDDVLAVGHRALRGHIETNPEAEVEGKTVDTVITEILAEVFLGQRSAPANP